uniref:Uncharacterized protein n=1 Tax=Lepeophtheirus salmonis TaxID=72036 RepID=A0A0K2TAL6_LEPSM
MERLFSINNVTISSRFCGVYLSIIKFGHFYNTMVKAKLSLTSHKQDSAQSKWERDFAPLVIYTDIPCYFVVSYRLPLLA